MSINDHALAAPPRDTEEIIKRWYRGDGGGFLSALAATWQAADSVNRARIEEAWADKFSSWRTQLGGGSKPNLGDLVVPHALTDIERELLDVLRWLRSGLPEGSRGRIAAESAILKFTGSTA